MAFGNNLSEAFVSLKRLKNYSEQRSESFSVIYEFEVKLRPLL